MTLSINDFKVYMPAKDFEQPKQFYKSLGFEHVGGVFTNRAIT